MWVRTRVYGSAFDPVLPGSGGSSPTSYNPNFGPAPVGGSGGGVIRLTAHSIVVNGTISADGGEGLPGGGGGAGAGSGGSIKLQLNGGSLSGSGIISAKSGVPTAGYPASGAGRVAIVGYSDNTFAGDLLGRAGTIFTQAAGTGGHLLLDGTRLTFAANTTNTFGSFSATTTGTSILYNHGTMAMSDDTLVIGPGVSLMQNGVVKGANRPDDWIGTVTVQSNGVISHSPGNTNGLRLQVAGVLQIDAGGRIDVKGRGLLGGNAGSGTNYGGYFLGEGFLPDNVAIARMVQTGAAHGSLGGTGNQTLYHLLYGSATDPLLPGSGGGASVNYNPNFGPAPVGGNGGGVVRIVAHDLVVNGVITADGGNAVAGAGAGCGGSGGSINVQLSGGSFAGSGIISTAGGTSNPGMPASGGGRIAIVGHTNQAFTGTLGRAGTIFTKLQGSGGHLQLDGTTLTIAAATTNTFGSFSATTNGTSIIYNHGTLVMSGDTLVIGPGVSLMQNGVVKGANRPDNWIGSVTVQTNGVIWHSQGNTNGVQLNVVGTLAVELGGRIDVTGRGYLGGYYPGNPFGGRGETRGMGGVPAAGANGNSGGSYGSSGGGSAPNPLYGSETAPEDLGSGGASAGANIWGGFGGGRMELRAHSLVVDGALQANGTGSYLPSTGQTPFDQGGGSGGAIYVVLSGGTFAGNGVIEAKGGPSLGANVGGGGRISISGHSSTEFLGFPLARFTPTDGSGDVNPTRFTGVILGGSLYLNARPLPPVQSDRIVNELTSLLVTNTATDLDASNKLSYALLDAPAGATISSNGLISWLPPESDGPSTNIVTAVVWDDATVPLYATNSLAVVANEVNVAPVLILPLDAVVNELVPFTTSATATDSDIPLNSLTFALVSGPAGLAVSADGQLNWTPGETQGAGTYQIFISVTDTNPPAVNTTSLSVTSGFSITVHEVNMAPVLTAPTHQTINEAQAYAANAMAFDGDLPWNALKVELVSGPTGLTVSPEGDIAWTPNEDQGPGTNLILLRLTDTNPPAINATSLSVTSSFELVIREMNVPPLLNLPANTNINEMATWAVSATATDADNPTNALVFALVSGPAGLSVSPSGGISWTPTETQGPGTNIVLISVTDTNPIAINADSLSVTSSFEVVVGEFNTAPVLNLPANTNVNELVAFTAQATATDTDDPTNALTFALVSGPAGLTVSPSGTINWMPTEEQGPGTNTVVIRVTDTNAVAVSANSLSVTRSFELVVNEVNLAPYVPLESLPPHPTINELAPYNVVLTAVDLDQPTNQLTFQLISGPLGLTATAVGGVNWTPSETQGPGTYHVMLRVFDHSPHAVNTVSMTNIIRFVLHVGEINLSPVLAPLADHTVNPGQTISFTATATDADLPTNPLSYALVSPPSGADITSDGQFTWRAPAALADTTNTIQVQVQDNGVPVFNDVKSFTVIVNSLGAPVVLTPVSYVNGQFRFQISGPVGPDYVTEVSTNLSDWLRIGTNQAPTLPFEFNDPAAGAYSHRGYRVRLSP